MTIAIYMPGHAQRAAKDLAAIRAIYAKYEHATDPRGQELRNNAAIVIARLESECAEASANFQILFGTPLNPN